MGVDLKQLFSYSFCQGLFESFHTLNYCQSRAMYKSSVNHFGDLLGPTVRAHSE